MRSTPSQVSSMSSTVPHLSKLSTIPALGILLFALMVTSWTGSSVAATPPPIPPGYSSEIIHVKFREGTSLDQPQMVLAPGLRNAAASITRLFSLPTQKLNEMRARGRNRSGKTLSDLNLWFQITLQPGTDAAAFLEDLKRLPDIELAEPAPLPRLPPAITPDFTGNQGYLNAAPGGIDARFSWTISGGSATGVKIYDVEYSWHQTHEDLSKAHGIPLLLDTGDSANDPFNDDNHGTAVLGEMIADNDTKGVTGISWSADIGLAPANTANLGYNPANAILLAVDDGAAGDMILIEQQQPVCGGLCDTTQVGCGPPEVISSVFNAIQTAVANGFVVVETAGNGNVNLDNQAACGTIFDRTVRDSGAIIVGAGRPPGSGADRQREAFSTYGSRVDVQGWGSSVMTTGYGSFYTNPDDPTNHDFWYLAIFGGTSGAAPMAAGAAANLQGIALDRFGVPLTSLQIRTLLVETGSPQLGDTTQHIGPRPDLRQAIAQLAIEDNTPPICSITGSGTDGGGHKFIQISIQDTGSGLASIQTLAATNATVNIPGFTTGTTNPVVVTATKMDNSISSSVSLQASDVAGNTTTPPACDPIMLEEIRSTGQPVSHTLTDIPEEENKVTVLNGNPGVTSLEINVNGKRFTVAGLSDGQEKTIDVSSVMVEGNNNTITVTAFGKPGGSASVLIHE
jgi:serine protease